MVGTVLATGSGGFRIRRITDNPRIINVVIRPGGRVRRLYKAQVHATVPISEAKVLASPRRFDRGGGRGRLRELLDKVETEHESRPVWFPDPEWLPRIEHREQAELQRPHVGVLALRYLCVVKGGVEEEPRDYRRGGPVMKPDWQLGEVTYVGRMPQAGFEVAGWRLEVPGNHRPMRLDSSAECVHLAEVLNGIGSFDPGVNYAIR